MANIFAFGFEKGPDGNSVAATDMGQGATLSGTGMLAYDSTTKAGGSYSCMMNSFYAYKYVEFPVVASPTVYSRVYLYIASVSTSYQVLLRTRNSTNAIADLQVTSAGLLRIMQGGATAVWTSSNNYVGKWVRVEWRVTNNTNLTGDQAIRLYSGTNLHGTSTTVGTTYETSGVQAVDLYADGITKFRMGSSIVSPCVAYFDEIVVDDAGYVGPLTTAPTANFTNTSATGTAPLSVTFTNTSTGTGNTYLWDFGDGSASVTTTSPSHTFSAGGPYTVTLTATNSAGSNQKTTTVTATSGAALWSSSFDTGTVGQAPTTASETGLENVSAGTNIVYSTTAKIHGAQSLAVTCSAYKTLQYTLTGQTTIGFRAYIKVDSLPASGSTNLFSLRDATGVLARVGINSTGTITLYDGSAGYATSSWVLPLAWNRLEWKITTGSQEIRRFSYSNRDGSTADDFLTHTAPTSLPTDRFDFGCVAASTSADGLIYLDGVAIGTDWPGPLSTTTSGAPVASFDVSSTSITAGGTVTFTDTSTNTPTSWVWVWGDGTANGSTQNPTHTYASAGDYNVTLRATNGSGSNTTAATKISVASVTGQAVVKVRKGGAWVTATSKVKARAGSIWGAGLVRARKAGVWTGKTPPTTNTRFPGDPGNGKIYVGWVQEGDNHAEWEDEVAKMRTIAYPSGSADATRTPMIYKNYKSWKSLPYTSHTSGGYDACNTYGVRVLYTTWAMKPSDQTNLLNDVAADVTFVKNLAAQIKDIAAIGGVVWVNILHEPEAPDSGLVYSAPTALNISDELARSRRADARAAQRKFRKILLAEGATTFAFIGPAFMNHTPQSANTDLTSYLADPSGSRADGWWEYHPDWKGTITNWTNGKTPNPADFYIARTGNPDTDRVMDMAGLDPYCWHGLGGADPEYFEPDKYLWTWTSSAHSNRASWGTSSEAENIYERHDLYEFDQYFTTDNHAYAYRLLLNNLYGTNVMPIMHSECGYPIFEDSGSVAPDVAITLRHWDYMYQQMISNAVVGHVHWKSIGVTTDLTTTAQGFGGRYRKYTAIPRCGSSTGESRTICMTTYPTSPNYEEPKGAYDSNETRRKAISKWLDEPTTIKSDSAPTFTASFNVSDQTVIVGTTVTFTDTTTGTPTSWAWNFGGSEGTSSLQNPTHTYNTVGSYTVTMTATNGVGTSSTATSKSVSVSAVTSPKASFDISDSSPTPGTTVAFTDTSSPAASTWAWTFGTGMGTSSAKNPTKTYTTAGTYTVTLTVNGGSVATATIVCAAAGTSRFAGDPGAGKFYIGTTRMFAPNGTSAAASTPAGRLQYFNDLLSTSTKTRHADVSRCYSSDDSPPWDEIDGAISKGMIPWFSFRPKSKSMSAIGAGSEDAYLDAIADKLVSYKPKIIWWTYYHEPEDNTKSFSAGLTLRKAVRRIHARFQARGATNTALMAVQYMTPFSFTASDRDWRWWYPDYRVGLPGEITTPYGTKNSPDARDFYIGTNSNRIVDAISHDIYNRVHQFDDGHKDPPLSLNDWKTYYGGNATKAGERYNWSTGGDGTNWMKADLQVAHNQQSILGRPYVYGELSAYPDLTVTDAGARSQTATNVSNTIDSFNSMMSTTSMGSICFCWYNKVHWQLEAYDPQLARIQGFRKMYDDPSHATSPNKNW